MRIDRTIEKENPLKAEILADDASGDHEKRLARYAVAMDRKQETVDHIIKRIEEDDNVNLDKELKALQDCGAFLIYRHYYLADRYRLLAGCTCKKHMLCPLCAIRRAAKCVAVGSQKIQDVVQRGLNPVKDDEDDDQELVATEYDQVMITLTIKNGEDLTERFEHLQASFKALIQKRRNSLKKRPKTDTVFKYVLGSIYSYEVTFSEGKGYHPHCHMIAMIAKGQFEYAERWDKKAKKNVKVPLELWAGLVEDWQSITGDSFIVDVRLIDDEKDQMSALVECFKYALKFSDMDVNTQLDCYIALKGRRMLDSMGCLRGIKFPDGLTDALLPGEEKFVDIVYRYSGISFGYQEISRNGVGLPENFNEQVLKGTLFKDGSFRGEKGTLVIHNDSDGTHRLTRQKLADAPF